MCWPPFPAAPIGLEQRTVASGSCDRPNVQTLQHNVSQQSPTAVECGCQLTLESFLDIASRSQNVPAD
ncbi:hypothetical protein UY3_02093 [Chelonia mydas]|uniref:Uncharacterized protein n=1 Tax=Chelonia mydas TaxID=8469 RepID=M7C7X2_CHEMY|nr:hypothetical protein UY3_02093 [Chelonia mydas]